MKTEAWKRLSSGRYVDLNSLRSEDIDVHDIETSLNHIIRFTGHYKSRPPLTVAQHSLLCLNLAQADEPENYLLHLYVFIHDFAEAYIGDVATPVKKAMGNYWYDFARPIENLVTLVTANDQAITPELHDKVKYYDTAALDIERRAMWRDQTGKEKWPQKVSSATLVEKVRSYTEVAEINFIPIYSIWTELYDLAFQTSYPRLQGGGSDLLSLQPKVS